MNRNENLKQLAHGPFDLCIIGGGASGAGAALDATLRGLKVCLIEKEDFASETSSRSTKLIHGGVRYLEQAFKKLDFGQLKQVKHGLAERHTVLKVAPHLAKPLGLITPVFSWLEGFYFTLGLKLYGLFAKNDTLPKAQWLSKSQTLQKIPTLSSKMHSSVLYYDGQLDDSRFCLALIHSADEKGACVLNHMVLERFQKDVTGKILAAESRDSISGEKYCIQAKVFLNCTGPYADAIRRLANPEEELRMRPSKGVHILFSNEFMPSIDAMLIPKTKDGRVVFVIPFEGEVMAGTTDTPYMELEKEPLLVSNEVDFLLETIESYFEKRPSRADIKAGFAGIRPLLAPRQNPDKKSTKTLLRDHEVEIDVKSGLISLLGGKWTTYRLMAEDAIDAVEMQLNRKTSCETANYHLVGAQNAAFSKEMFFENASKLGLEKEVYEHLWNKYGDRAERIVEIAKENTKMRGKIHEAYPFILAEVSYAIQEEMVLTFRDFYARRIRMEITNWDAVLLSLDKVGEVFKEKLKWSDSMLEDQKSNYKSLISSFKSEAGL